MDCQWHSVCMGLCAARCGFISPSTTLARSSCTPSPPGSHGCVCEEGTAQTHPACPQPAWHRTRSVRMSMPHSICRPNSPALLNSSENPARGLGAQRRQPPSQLHHLSHKTTNCSNGVSCCLQKHIYCSNHLKFDF